MKELINIYSDLLEKHFPKHKCKERGQALVLIAELNTAILSLMKSIVPEEKKEEGLGSEGSSIRVSSHNACREEMLKRLEE